MATRSVRWLHLSDFHVGKDNYAQRSMFDKIVEHTRKRVSEGCIPDFLFLTGDLANRGLSSEYEEFSLGLLLPLQEVIGSGIDQRTFAVPGNHDVARDENEAFSREEMVEPKSRYFDPSPEGKKKRSLLTPRFARFIAGDLTARPGWLDSDDGAFKTVEECRGLKIGIVGVNTAWLSKDDKDENKLTPGKALLESALATLGECDLRIVLGHHPLDWIIADQRKMIRSVLGNHRAIYLHGHLHESWAEPLFGAGNTFLAVQSGASFQAREGEPWRNGLLWAEAAIDEQLLWLQPWNWNAAHQDWSIASDAFPDSLRSGVRWRYPLPGTEQSKTLNQSTGKAPVHAVPKGWEVVSIGDLKARIGPLDAEAALKYFDGAIPDWKVALSPSTPRREVVATLASWYRGRPSRTVAGLLLGPGCEGKTTAVMQAAYALLQDEPNWIVLRRVDEAAPVPPEELLAVFQADVSYLVVIDEADRAAESVHALIGRLSSAGINGVHFLLASRDTDWVSSGAGRFSWASTCSFRQVKLAGISDTDARRIVEAWTAYGGHVLGELEKVEEADRTERFIAAVHKEAEVSEGAFFGGLLRVRKGGDLRHHARLMLERLEQRPIPSGGTLSRALGFVAAMHAEGLAFLSRPVLAEALGCPLERLRRDVLIPLGSEAATTTNSEFVFTRHRAVAEAVVSVLRDEFGEDTEEYFRLLAKSAVLARRGAFIPPNVSVWNFDLARHFFMSRRHSLAIRIAQSVQEAEPHNAQTLTNLASLYREAGDPENALTLFEELPPQVRSDRGLCQEWGTTAGACNRFRDNALILAFALADQCGHRPIDNDGAKLGLAGLGVALARLYEESGDHVFLVGRAAVAVMGQKLRLDATTAGYFRRYAEESAAQGAGTPTLDQAPHLLHNAVRAAAQSGISEAVSDQVATAEALSFVNLQRLLLRAASNRTHMGANPRDPATAG